MAPEYAGHEERYREEFYRDFNELADDIFNQIKGKLSGNYALFGYSMGSIALVEILKRIMASGLSQLGNIFLAAHEPHTKSELLGYTEDKLDDWVKERTIRFGAVPEKLMHNKVFWRTYLLLYRADYAIIGKYEFEKLNIKSEIPTTIFYSEIDTPLVDMKQWENYFPCEFHHYSGTHFFIQEHHAEMGEVIMNKMGVK